ncbi:MAG: amidohydrolase [Sulfuricurvum sp.]|uniref:amidohydrolase n=1 Tax=Algoriphagus sp. TaxID=1872435 RepID=UPI002730395B|nr:amidohydrolase [Algoriphagus sp.]MDP2039898.1 amidohydrolase [Algoriphagus sp.]MDP3464317.1 amidohydrolase [Sulfuricurvum sp.]
MKKRYLVIAAAFISATSPLFAQKNTTKPNPLKQTVQLTIESRFAAMTELSDQIWAFEEIAFQEVKSSAALSAYAEELGFKVTRGVGEIPTAFVAEYGSGSPIIGIMGEFDGLPGLSQNKVPFKSPLHEDAPGHGCGHNLFGVASLSAAGAIKDLIADGKIKGTIRFYGTPAEEKFFGKLWMLRAGLMDDVDIMMDWHPEDQTKTDVQKGLALVDFIVEFNGQAAHASADPWNGRSASDALELYTNGINYFREHVKPTVRMHYHIQDGGQVVNVVPDYSRLWVRVRDTSREGLMPVWKQVEKMAEGAAILANVSHKVTLVSGVHEILVNRSGSVAMQTNLEALGPITYTEEEQSFAKKIQEATGKPQIGLVSVIKPLEETLEHSMGGSTDVGDVSWVVPTIRMTATTAPNGTPWHSWAVVASGGMSIGHKGMGYAAKALAMTMVDLYQNETLRNEIKAEFKARKGDYVYKGIVPDGPPPLNAGY